MSFGRRIWSSVPPSSVSYSAAVLALSPSGYWRLDEPSGSTATDSSGNGKDGAYVNTPTQGVAGALTDGNAAVELTAASSEYVNVSGLTLTGASAVSLICWTKKVGGGGFSDCGLISSSGSGALTGIYIYLATTDQISLAIENTTTNLYDTAGLLNNGSWHMVAAIWDGSVSSIYFDGALVDGPDAAAVGPLTGTHNVRMGQYGVNSGTYNNMGLDEGAVWNGTALTGSDISTLYTAGTT